MIDRHRATLADHTRYVRSKNAGPFQIAIDIVFESEAAYIDAQRLRLITPATVAAAYGVPQSDVIAVHTWDEPLAIKVVLRRPVSAGAPGDTDCYGAQQQEPMAAIQWPVDAARLGATK